MSESYVTEEQLAEAVSAAHRLETQLLQTQIERLTAVIREHELSLPAEDPRLGASDGDHLAACRRVVCAAYDLLVVADEFESALAGLRAVVGSGMELVEGAPWRSSRQTTSS